jgi:nucleoside-diphosphate-sugar epimerase
VIDFCAYTPGDIETVLSVLPGNRVGHYVYVSTATLYAKTNVFPIKEASPKLQVPRPERGPIAEYGYNKWRAEIALEKCCKAKGIPHTSIRPAFIYGKYNYVPRESYFFDLMLKKEVIVMPKDGLSLFSFVSVWDLARILIGCLHNPRVQGGGFNAAGDELISYDGLLEVVESVTGVKPAVQRIPVDALHEKRISLPFSFQEHLIYSGKLIRDILNFHYTPFLEGMREIYRYYLIGRGLH